MLQVSQQVPCLGCTEAPFAAYDLKPSSSNNKLINDNQSLSANRASIDSSSPSIDGRNADRLKHPSIKLERQAYRLHVTTIAGRFRVGSQGFLAID